MERCPPVFHPSMMCVWGEKVSHTCVWSGIMWCVCGPRVPVWSRGYTCVRRCDGRQEASFTRPCSGSSGPGCPFLFQGMAAPVPAPGPSPRWGSRAGLCFLYWGPEGGSGRPGNFTGILGIWPFRGSGGAWKSPTRRGSCGDRGLGLLVSGTRGWTLPPRREQRRRHLQN